MARAGLSAVGELIQQELLYDRFNSNIRFCDDTIRLSHSRCATKIRFGENAMSVFMTLVLYAVALVYSFVQIAFSKH